MFVLNFQMYSRIVESESSFASEHQETNSFEGSNVCDSSNEGSSDFPSSGHGIVECGVSFQEAFSKPFLCCELSSDHTGDGSRPEVNISENGSISPSNSEEWQKKQSSDSYENCEKEGEGFKLLESALLTIEKGGDSLECAKTEVPREKKSKVKIVRPVIADCDTSYEEDTTNGDHASSTSEKDLQSRTTRSFGSNMKVVETSCGGSDDDISDPPKTNSKGNDSTKSKIVASCGTGNDSECEGRVFNMRPRIADNSTSYDDEPEGNGCDKKPSGRRLCAYQRSKLVEECCSTGDNASFSKVVGSRTVETGVGDEDVPVVNDSVSNSVVEKTGKISSGISCAIDPTCLDIEYKVARFVDNPEIAEYRFTGKLSQNQRNAIKHVAEERDLILRNLGKGKEKCVALRKKAQFLKRQRMAKELKEMEAEAKRVTEAKAAEAKQRRKVEIVWSKNVGQGLCESGIGPDGDEGVLDYDDYTGIRPRGVEMCIQTDDPDAPKRSRKKKVQKVDSSTQTCPEFFYVCMFCEQDIPEAIRGFHHVQCLREYKARKAQARAEASKREARQKQEQESRRRQKPLPSGTPHDQARRLLSGQSGKKPKPRRTEAEHEQAQEVKRAKRQKAPAAAKENPFGNVHENDINGLLSAARRLDIGAKEKEPIASDGEHEDGEVVASNGSGTEGKTITGFEKALLKKHLRERLSILAERRK